MGNTVFYNQINEDASQIKWKDIFSDYKKKHDKQDLEYALAAGTALNSASEEYMLQKWRKPWVFYPFLKWGLALMILLYVAFFGLSYTIGSTSGTLYNMTVIIPPLIPSVIMLVLFWEMNIPRNISIVELLGMWLVGGIISFVVVSVLFIPFPDDLPAFFGAPIREEPAKFIASLIILIFISRNKKIYGITGFVVGAAVGAGFGAFESVSYALNFAEYTGILDIHKARIISALSGGHLLYCAPYAAAIALHMKDNKVKIGSIFNVDFIVSFVVVCLMHGLWDVGFPWPVNVLLGICEWMWALRMLRKCLDQAVQIGAAASGGMALQHGAGDGATSFIDVKRVERKTETTPQPKVAGLKLTCNRGELKGVQWQSTGNAPMLVGRNSNCDICFSAEAKGVSGQHCSIQLTKFGWTVKDLGSSYGTFVSGGQKILPGTEVKLKQGDVISLGGEENTLTVDLSI